MMMPRHRFACVVFIARVVTRGAAVHSQRRLGRHAGKGIRLDLDPSSGAGFPSRIGDRVTKIYTAGSLRVEAVYTATCVCPPNQESCEVTMTRTLQ